MRSALSIPVAGLIILMQFGCATHSARERVEAKIAAEDPANSPGEIASRGATYFGMAETLNPEEKNKLNQIQAYVHKEVVRIRAEMGKAKSALFKELVSPNYQKSQVDLLKERIVQLDQERLRVMFRALEDVEAVLGHGEKAAPIYRHIYEYERGPSERMGFSVGP